MKCKFCGERMSLSDEIPDQVMDQGLYYYVCECGASAQAVYKTTSASARSAALIGWRRWRWTRPMTAITCSKMKGG